jgi:hypothetical protein
LVLPLCRANYAGYLGPGYTTSASNCHLLVLVSMPILMGFGQTVQSPKCRVQARHLQAANQCSESVSFV